MKKPQFHPLQSERLKKEIKKAGLRLPRQLTVMITNGCNLNCRHCWPESVSHKSIDPVPVEPLKHLMTGFCALGILEICLTGGEPLTHPEWYELLRFACAQDGLKQVRLQTNGTLVTEENAGLLASMDKNKLIIQVSLEGDTSTSHDVLRGKGSFQKALRGLTYLTAAGLGPQTVVAFTETRSNFDGIPTLLEYLEEIGIGGFTSGTLVQAGRAAENPDLMRPTPEQYRTLLRRYGRDRDFRKRYHRMANIACLEWWFGKNNSTSEDCACLELPYVTAEGSLYPCLMLPADHLAVENVFQRPLQEFLKEAITRWSELPIFKKRRFTELSQCHACSGRTHCRGGCMGRAYAATGDFMTVEDRCALRKAVYALEGLTG